ncbi:MAG TPA: efflux RND transporter periplasmic adaptor subunit, partial [Gammaproteobacteria bacterium]|nr:efflux RND transporter periplasmic adaptor subunit [Gammaproteobacteria bacterium]
DKLDPRILPQMGVQVWFYAEASKNPEPQITRIVIPQTAVHADSSNQYVYLVVQGYVKQQSVKTLPAPDKQVTVLSGLSGGEKLVVSSKTPLHDGESVKEQNP